MRRGWMLVAIAVIAICMVAGCVREVKTYADPGQPIDIGVNNEFIIALEGEDMHRGLHWQAQYDATMLDLVDVEHFLNGDIGQFKFKAVKTGETEITMDYVQWSASKEVGEEFVWLEPQVFTVSIR